MPETNPASPRAALSGASGKGLWKTSPGGDTGGGRMEATHPLASGTHWAASLGPTWCSKCATSHLALHFPHFSQVHLEYIRKGSGWFGKCLGNSGCGRWSWKPVGKNMTPRQSSELWLESCSPASPGRAPRPPALRPYPSGGLWLHLHPSETPFQTGCVRRHPSVHPSSSPHILLLLLLPTQTTNSAQALLHE